MLKPTLEEAKKLREDYKVIPVALEMMSDIRTPIEVLKILKTLSPHCYILESVERQEKWGRYTFLGFAPKMCITCINGTIKVNNLEEKSESVYKDCNPAQFIRNLLKDYTSPKFPDFPTFTGGLVGYFSYDYIKYSEPCLKLDAKDDDGFYDMDLMLFDKVIAFDNMKQKLYLIENIRTKHLEKDYEKVEKSLKELKELLIRGTEVELPKTKLKSEFKPLFNQQEFCTMVEKAKNYIYEGDIFQVVLSNRLEAEFEGSLLDTYRVLRTLNPSPYMFYFSGDDIEVAGASPETLVKLENGVLHTFPLAGTKPRGKDEREDKELERQLLADEKECAEHNMLVDLGRNDLGKISSFGSVSVEKYMSIERYSHVMHIGSTVRGEIAEGYSAIDAIDAVLPAGTLSGAPKIRACEIINELEDNKRGIYGGAVGYIDFTGNLDTCIAIRLAFAKNGKVFVRSGAGIVADSIPENEYRECIHKAAAVMKALEMAGEV